MLRIVCTCWYTRESTYYVLVVLCHPACYLQVLMLLYYVDVSNGRKLNCKDQLTKSSYSQHICISQPKDLTLPYVQYTKVTATRA